MRTREKLTLEEKFALALELIKRVRSLDEIRMHYRVSHTTAYKIRNTFLEGGRAALTGERRSRRARDLEARVSALEALMRSNGEHRKPVARLKNFALADGEGLASDRRAGK
jgi:transposase